MLLRAPAPLSVAGRTDAGVHALAQVASYRGPPQPVAALNALLPPDIAVLECEAVAPGFDARQDATSRAYRYRVLVRAARSALEAGRALHWRAPLRREALDGCAAALLGAHDFTAFTPSQTTHVRFEREVLAAYWQQRGAVLEFSIEADAFLRHMNRVLVGTMLEVAAGRRSGEQFLSLLEGRPRREAGPTAPAHGLFLVGVGYDGRRVLGSVGEPPRRRGWHRPG